MKTSTIDQFIENVENRKNMKRGSNVTFDTSKFELVNEDKYNQYFKYKYNDKDYDVHIYEQTNNMFRIEISISGFDFEIGDIIDDKEECNIPDKKIYTAFLDCDCKFF